MSNFTCKGTLAKLLTGLMVAAIFSAAFVVAGPSAKAATSGTATGTATISGGTLALTAPADFSFSGVTLDGMNAQTSTGTFSVGVDDPTGTNAGWELKASLTLLTDGAQHTLPDPAQIVSSTDITPSDSAGSTAAVNSDHTPFTFPTSAGSAAVFYNAAAGSGQGQHTYSVKVTQNVAKNSYAGTYTGTLTVSLDNGPQ